METVMGFDQAVVRRADGRFLPGCSGRSAGKRPGTKNGAMLLIEAMEAGKAAAA